MKFTFCAVVVIAAIARALAASAASNDEWNAVSRVRCSDAAAKNWSSPVWTIVQDVDDQVIDHVCKTRLVYVECMNNPNWTVGQALACIYYKIEFGGNLPAFRCGA
jgi:hypothetical protein